MESTSFSSRLDLGRKVLSKDIENTSENIVCKDLFIFEYSFRLHTAWKSETL